MNSTQSYQEKRIDEDYRNLKEGKPLQHFKSEKALKRADEQQMLEDIGAYDPKPFNERQEYRDWHYQRGIYNPE